MNKCPDCGAPFKHTACDGRNVVYECGRVGRTAGGPTESKECLRRQLAQRDERIEELEGAVGIAKTADGELKCEGDKIWFPWKDEYSVSSLATGIVCIRASTEEGYRFIKRGYSTEALAAAAAQADAKEKVK